MMVNVAIDQEQLAGSPWRAALDHRVHHPGARFCRGEILGTHPSHVDRGVPAASLETGRPRSVGLAITGCL